MTELQRYEQKLRVIEGAKGIDGMIDKGSARIRAARADATRKLDQTRVEIREKQKLIKVLQKLVKAYDTV